MLSLLGEAVNSRVASSLSLSAPRVRCTVQVSGAALKRNAEGSVYAPPHMSAWLRATSSLSGVRG